MTRTLLAVLTVAMLVLAGCSASVPGTDTPNAQNTAAAGDGTATGSDSGSLTFYVSDERNDIGDFEHLNVTITKVGFHRVGSDEEGDAEAENVTATSNATETATPTPNATETATPTPTATPNATVTATPTPDEATGPAVQEENETATPTPNATETATPTPNATETADAAAESESENRGGWVERDVERTVDLTELQGSNSAQLAQFDLPSGDYNKVFIYVSEVNGTLKNGEHVDVKLPSNKLRLNQGFTIGNGEDVEFVYDITVVKAGHSGRYNIKPVAGESGTDVPITRVDTENEDGLRAKFVGDVTAGENATVAVTDADGPVEGATVTVGEETYTTDANGTATVPVPADAEELEVTVTYEDSEVELQADLSGTGETAAADDENETETGDESRGKSDGKGKDDLDTSPWMTA